MKENDYRIVIAALFSFCFTGSHGRMVLPLYATVLKVMQNRLDIETLYLPDCVLVDRGRVVGVRFPQLDPPLVLVGCLFNSTHDFSLFMAGGIPPSERKAISTDEWFIQTCSDVVSAFARESEDTMRMSRSTAYAISAVLQLASSPPGVPVPCTRLAKVGEMPERFLLQILRNLVNHGLLKSTRGVEGGYSLLGSVSEITLLQIFEVTEGPLTPSIPPLDALPAGAQTRLHEVLGEIGAATCQILSKVKISDLVAEKKNVGAIPPNE